MRLGREGRPYHSLLRIISVLQTIASRHSSDGVGGWGTPQSPPVYPSTLLREVEEGPSIGTSLSPFGPAVGSGPSLLYHGGREVTSSFFFFRFRPNSCHVSEFCVMVFRGPKLVFNE